MAKLLFKLGVKDAREGPAAIRQTLEFVSYYERLASAAYRATAMERLQLSAFGQITELEEDQTFMKLLGK